MKKFVALLGALLGLGGVARSADPISIHDVNDYSRVYKTACDIIEPYMRLHDRPVKKVTSGVAVQLNEAIQMLDAVTAYNPKNWNAFWIKGKAYQAMEDRHAACAAFKEAFDLQDKNPDVAREYMYECLKLGDGAEGLRAAQRAVDLNPSDAGLHANLALALVIAAKPRDALKAIDEALQMAPGDRISQNVRKVILKIIDGTKPLPRTLSELAS
jgi:tetratricopeptide (TPR) repeat protein